MHMLHKWGRWTMFLNTFQKRECIKCGKVQHRRIWTKGA